MTVIAPPLDTGGGAIFPYTGRNHAAESGENGAGNYSGTAGLDAGRAEHVFDMLTA